jgi:hypothetical protein
MTPSPALLKAYAARDPAYVLFKPDDMPAGEWWFLLEALAFARQACKKNEACEKTARAGEPARAVPV